MKDKKFINHLAEVLCEIAKRENILERIQEELKTSIQVVKNERVRRVLYHPKLSLKEKGELLRQALSSYAISETTISFLNLLLEDEKLDYLKEVSLRYKELSDKILNLKKVVVTTAIPLEEQERDRLIETFERLTASKVKLEECIDERILGGVVVRVGDRLIDGSIHSSLYKLKEEMAT